MYDHTNEAVVHWAIQLLPSKVQCVEGERMSSSWIALCISVMMGILSRASFL